LPRKENTPVRTQHEHGGILKVLKNTLALLLIFAVVLAAQGNSFDRIRYNGGSVDSKVDAKDWHNRLTVSSDIITLALKDGKTLEIPPKNVTSLSYGQEAHRRVGTMIALAIIVSPIALFGLMHKTRLHFIGIQYSTSDSKTAGILLQGDKDNYRAILVALQGVTGVPVSVGEKDREFIPVGVTTNVSRDTDEKTTESLPAAPSNETAKGAVNVSSSPSGADILIDGDFVGNSPAALKLSPGKHSVTVKLVGYADWTRDITVQAASEVQLTANLVK
jgi:hypothetical protein